MIISVFDRVENIVAKEENAGYQHFLLYPQCFQAAFYSSASKVAIVWYRVKKIVYEEIVYDAQWTTDTR